jgi:hypothetical protein
MVGERFEVLLADLLACIGRRRLGAVARDLVGVFALRLLCCDSERRNRDTGVTAGIVRDGFEFLIGDGVAD